MFQDNSIPQFIMQSDVAFHQARHMTLWALHYPNIKLHLYDIYADVSLEMTGGYVYMSFKSPIAFPL